MPIRTGRHKRSFTLRWGAPATAPDQGLGHQRVPPKLDWRFGALVTFLSVVPTIMRRRILVLSALTVVMATTNVFASTAPREATLQASAAEVTYRDEVTLSGQISAPPETQAGCVAGVEVVIRVWGPSDIAPPSPDRWPELGRTTTDAAGLFAFTFQPGATASYVAHVVQDSPAGCDAAISDAVGVGVRALVKIRVRDRVVDRGEKARFTVRVRPHCQGFSPDPMPQLQRRRRSGFVTVAEKEPKDPERCVVKFNERVRSSARYRGAIGPICGFACPYRAGWSRAVKIKVQAA